jgi:Single-stranded DNA-specific exonuclease
MIEVNESYGKAFDIAANKIKESNFLRVYSHYDADGVSSASIIASFLSRLNKRFHLTFLKQLDINEISKNNGELVILSDLGSDGLNPENFEVILVDHHEPPGNNKNIINLNPRSYGYDGTKEACSSTVAFILSLRINEENKDLYRFFLSGSIGDKQGVGGFKGLNKQIIERLGIKERKSLNLGPGKVADAITYSTDPFFVSLTGYEEKVIQSFWKLSK